MGDFVRVETESGIATIRLDRPPMNALNSQVQAEIGSAAAQAAADPDVRSVILYGGEKLFAAGADVKEMAEASHARVMEIGIGIQEAFKTVARIPKPVIAAITGYALGGGLELALCADFRILGEKAKVGQPEILLGIIPGAGGTQRLPRLIGPSRAKDLVFSGRIADAAEALRIGLADRVVAEPGSRDYGQLSIAVQMHGPAVRLFTLPPSAFAPPPQVHSTVFRWRFAPRFQELNVEEASFLHLIRIAFAQKRKTLANNLRAAGMVPAAITTALAHAAIDPHARAEALSIETLANLWRDLETEGATPPGEVAPDSEPASF